MQVGFSFAKLLRNFCGTERNILLPLRKILLAKKAFCAIKRISHFAQNFAIPHVRKSVLRNYVCSIPLFRNVPTIYDTFSWKWKSDSNSSCFLGLTDVRLFISNLYWLKVLLCWFLFSRHSVSILFWFIFSFKLLIALINRGKEKKPEIFLKIFV